MDVQCRVFSHETIYIKTTKTDLVGSIYVFVIKYSKKKKLPT